MISIIVPVLNEEKKVQKFLTHLTQLKGKKEIIVVDGGSTDKTKKLVRMFKNVKLITSQKGRGQQQNKGAYKAKGDILLFLHADTLLPKKALSHINNRPVHYAWGAFFTEFDIKTIFLNVISWKANHSRLALFSLPFGDQAIFVRKKMFNKVKGFPNIPIMEDAELSKKLRCHGEPYIIKDKVTTSAQKFRMQGPLRTYIKIGIIRLLHVLGVPPKTLYTFYYKG